MILKRLSIINFRNIAQAELELSDGLNCLIGDNGMGKTNVLDAVYFLSMCRSAATSQDSTTVRHGEAFMALQGHYEREDGTPEDVTCGLKLGHKKTFARSKKTYRRLADHIGLIPIVEVSPTDQSLITGGSEERRRFMDVVISQCDPTYIASLVNYNKALAQRNALLKQEEEPDPELLDILEDTMGREGEAIYGKRAEYIDTLTPAFQRYYSHVAPQNEQVGLNYTSHCQRGSLAEVIRKGRQKDRIVGYSLHGIHKDDLEMTLSSFPIRREGSQGQNKSFLVALKLAQFDFLRHSGSRTTPILLLDDIFDKLDARRVEQIVHLVAGDDFGQIFITDTNRDHLALILSGMGKEHRLFHVKDGEVTL